MGRAQFRVARFVRISRVDPRGSVIDCRPMAAVAETPAEAEAFGIYDSSARGSAFVEEFLALIHYRDLITQLVSRNIKTRYKRSFLGIAWTMVNPLQMMGVLTLVFSRLFQASARDFALYAFSELHDFIDSPMRAYSSGMIARLGFAVATYRYADVVLVDEVLAVGDARFQEKCLRRLQAHRNLGATTHAAESIRAVCDRAIWLEHGRIRRVGSPPEVVAAYSAG